MRWRVKISGVASWLMLGLCLAVMLSGARADAYQQDQAGFGPTSPGVSSIVIDAATGDVIAQHGADIPRYPASLAKLMTLDLAFQALRDGKTTLDTMIPVSYHAASVEPVKLGLRPGSSISVRDAILAMTTMSANDAATALGEYLGGGSEARFAQMMTLRAHALGMAQTEFYNASGLPDPNQVSTARDLAILARNIVIDYPQFQPFFEVEKFNFRGEEVYSNNGMLKLYPGTTGMKTGYTDLARHNLVTTAQRDGRVLIGVVLHEPSWGASYDQMTAMLNSGFDGPFNPPDTAVAAAAPVAQPYQAPLRLARATRPQFHTRGIWADQLGMFHHIGSARVEAMNVHNMHGIGTPRIARIEQNGHVIWNAQLADLSLGAAYQTCDEVSARGDKCRVIPADSSHVAMVVASDLGT